MAKQYRQLLSTSSPFLKLNAKIVGDLGDRLEVDISSFCTNVVAYAQSLLYKKGRYATGELYRKLKYNMTEVQKEGSRLLNFKISSNAKASNGFRYGNTIEHGIKANHVAVDPDGILAWVKAKRIQGWKKRDSNGKSTSQVLSQDEIANLVTSSLIRKGKFKTLHEGGDKFLEKSYNRYIKELQSAVKNEIDTSMKQFINELFGR